MFYNIGSWRIGMAALYQLSGFSTRLVLPEREIFTKLTVLHGFIDLWALRMYSQNIFQCHYDQSEGRGVLAIKALLLPSSLTCGLYYKQVTIIIYDRKDIGLYYKTRDNRN